MQSFDTRRHGGFGRYHCIVAVVAALEQRRERAQAVVGSHLPCTDAAHIEATAFVTLRESPLRTPDEPARQTEITVPIRAVSLHDACPEVAQTHADADFIRGLGLAQPIVHDT